MQLVLALLAITGVFLLVPRGISVGTIEVHSTRMTFNSTTKTYRYACNPLLCSPQQQLIRFATAAKVGTCLQVGARQRHQNLVCSNAVVHFMATAALWHHFNVVPTSADRLN